MFRLSVIRNGVVAMSAEVASPCLLGRAPDNVISVVDESVSWRHAVVWPDGVRLFVKDLGSVNGTFVNGVRIVGVSPLDADDVLRLGDEVEVRVARDVVEHEPRIRIVEDVGLGVRMRVVGEQFLIGPGRNADLVTQSERATVRFLGDGRVVLIGPDGEQTLAYDEEFKVGARRLVVREVSDQRVRTGIRVPYPYLVVSKMGRAGECSATVSEPATGKSFEFGGNRALLLHLLACRRQDDLERALGSDAVGWCDDAEIKRALWGRAADDNKLNVLVHKLRLKLKEAGFDPWFVERNRRSLRLLVPVVVEDRPR